jgi:hypothetical protein
MLVRRNLDHVRKDPTIVLTLRFPIDEELLLAFELMPELIEQYDNIPASVQKELVRRQYQAPILGCRSTHQESDIVDYPKQVNVKPLPYWGNTLQQ